MRRADRPADEMETLSSESPRQVVDSARVALRRLPPAQEATDFVAAHLRSSLRSELSPWPPDTWNVLLRIGMWNGPDSRTVHLAVIQLLDTAPWFVIASFVGSAALAIAAEAWRRSVAPQRGSSGGQCPTTSLDADGSEESNTAGNECGDHQYVTATGQNHGAALG